MRTAPMPEPASWTILELVRWTTGYFSDNGFENGRGEAEMLLAHVLGVRRIDLYLNHDQPVEVDERRRFKELIRRRLEGEPAAYIVGTREFWSLELAVNPSVLIPRPETECLVEAVLPLLTTEAGPPKRVLDMGTGSGAIVIALAHTRPRHRYTGMDRSMTALATARRNARRHGLEERITWFCGDWEAPLAAGRPFDLIVSNPPYVRSGDIEGLQPEIRDHEPRLALDGSPDGLVCLRRLVGQAHRYLVAGGILALEIGFDQAGDMRALAEAAGGYASPTIIKDYSGHDRVAMLTRSA
jgi:release factor glutamine methyltransferase